MTYIFKYIASSLLLVLLLTRCTYTYGMKQTNTDTATDSAPAMDENFSDGKMLVNGVQIHFVKGGQGPALVLIHGFAENWYIWNRLLPELSKHFTVIMPELRGVGESGKPEGGYDKKNMAKDIHELIKKLGYKDVFVAGHDIGLMVAYAYAAQYSDEVKKLALLDAPLPGIEPYWSRTRAAAWWFGFFSWPAAAGIISGKEKEFLISFQADKSEVKNAFTDDENRELIHAYSEPGAIRGSFSWFAAFPQDARDNHEFMKHKLKMPVLAMGGEYASAGYIGNMVKLVATDVKEVTIKGAKHWIIQENTAQVQHALLNFLLTNNNQH